jgi:hypothetical protein
MEQKITLKNSNGPGAFGKRVQARRMDYMDLRDEDDTSEFFDSPSQIHIFVMSKGKLLIETSNGIKHRSAKCSIARGDGRRPRPEYFDFMGQRRPGSPVCGGSTLDADR